MIDKIVAIYSYDNGDILTLEYSGGSYIHLRDLVEIDYLLLQYRKYDSENNSYFAHCTEYFHTSDVSRARIAFLKRLVTKGKASNMGLSIDELIQHKLMKQENKEKVSTETQQTFFINVAGDHADTDDILREELKSAGITTLQEEAGKDAEFLADYLRRTSDEVITSVRGAMYGWTFKRNWNYWVCEGPGIEVEIAEQLHSSYGKYVRVAGDAGCPSPREFYKGLACGEYHVDTKEGLKALGDTIKFIVETKFVQKRNKD